LFHKAITQIIPTENEEIPIEKEDILFPQDNSSSNHFQTSTIQTENSTVVFDTTHTIFCHSNEIPLVPNAVLIQSELNLTYDVGTTLFFTCQPGHEALFNETSFTICSMNGTWSIDTININMCQLSK
jgi:hypothetical protein